jgi:hypothetical protein
MLPRASRQVLFDLMHRFYFLLTIFYQAPKVQMGVESFELAPAAVDTLNSVAMAVATKVFMKASAAVPLISRLEPAGCHLLHLAFRPCQKCRLTTQKKLLP